MGAPEQHKFRPTSAPVLPPPCYNDAQQYNEGNPSMKNTSYNFQQPPPPAYHQIPGYPYNPSSSSSSSYQPLHSHEQHGVYYYQPTPPPQTVVIQQRQSRTDDACCWGCLAALCLCFAAEECC